MSHRVLITGISGYIGLHCPAEALRSGYRVRGSVRNASKEQEVRDTLAASVDTANLEFVELDLTKEAGWDDDARSDVARQDAHGAKRRFPHGRRARCRSTARAGDDASRRRRAADYRRECRTWKLCRSCSDTEEQWIQRTEHPGCAEFPVAVHVAV
jgi:nucleoside-diphosphate-sugar epimerase